MNPSDPELQRLRAFLESSDTHASGGGDTLFGGLAVKRGFVTAEMVQECLDEQRKVRQEGANVRVGQLLLKRGYLTLAQFLEVLQVQQQYVLECAKCGKVYNISGHPAQVALLCLRCGDKLTVPSDTNALMQAEERGTPYNVPSYRPGEMYLGRYRLVREIARGGMGVVYEAEDPDLSRRVALKLLKEGDGAGRVVRRLQREAALAARLRHTNIITIHEVGAVRDPSGMLVHYICMDYVDGETLEEALKKQALDIPRIAEIMEQVSRAVHYAHTEGVIHRDMKPANILLEKTGRPVVTDFGLAKHEDDGHTKLTRSGAVMGTPLYMSPEQVEGKPSDVDRRSDVYALGVTLYEAVTGRPPFEAPSVMEVYRKIVQEDPRSPARLNGSVDRDLETIILKAMSREKDRRYASAEALAEDLLRYRQKEAIQARPPSTMYRLSRGLRRRKAVTVMGVALFLVLGIGGWAYLKVNREWKVRDLVTEIQNRYEEGRIAEVEQTLVALCELEGDSEVARFWKARLSLRRYQILRGLPQVRLVGGLTRIVPLTAETEEERRLRDVDSSHPLIDGIVALWKGEHDRALSRLTGTEGWESEFYQGVLRYLKGQFAEAKRLTAPHRSRDPVLVGPIWIQILIADALSSQLRGEDPGVTLDDADSACERLASVGEERMARVLRAQVLGLRAQWLFDHGEDPERRIAPALELLGEDDRPEAWLIRGDLKLLRAAYKAVRGEVDPANPEPYLEAMKAYDTLVERAKTADALVRRAEAQRTFADWSMGLGLEGVECYRAAIEDTRQALQVDSENLNAALLQAELLHRGQNRPDSQGLVLLMSQRVDAIRGVVERSPDYPLGWLKLGSSRMDLGRTMSRFGLDPRASFDQALRDLDHALELKPDYVQALVDSSLAHVEYAGHLIEKGEASRDAEIDDHFEASVHRAREAVKINPLKGRAFVAIGRARVMAAYRERRRNGDPIDLLREAVDAFSEALRISLLDLEAWTSRAWAHQNLACLEGSVPRNELAIADYTGVLQINPHHFTAYLGRGVTRANLAKLKSRSGADWKEIQKLFEESLEDLKSGSVLLPAEPSVWRELEWALLEYANLRESNMEDPTPQLLQLVGVLKKVVEIVPGDPAALRSLGQIYLRLHLGEEAVDALERAIDLDPSQEKSLQPLLEKARSQVRGNDS